VFQITDADENYGIWIRRWCEYLLIRDRCMESQGKRLGRWAIVSRHRNCISQWNVAYADL
jgi:hypothetical protein